MNVQDTVGIPDPSQSADEQARMRVSALIDSELDDAAIEATLDALLASDALTRFWLYAHCAGDWMRSDEVVGMGDNQRALRRISMVLAREPAIVAPKGATRSRSPGFWMRTGLPGASIAAALVAVAWVATPFWASDARNDTGKQGMASSSGTPSVVIATASPQSEAELPRAIDADRLSPYLAAHRDVTPFAYRGASARPAAFSSPASASSTPQ